jgi:hypothetical protein
MDILSAVKGKSASGNQDGLRAVHLPFHNPSVFYEGAYSECHCHRTFKL